MLSFSFWDLIHLNTSALNLQLLAWIHKDFWMCVSFAILKQESYAKLFYTNISNIGERVKVTLKPNACPSSFVRFCEANCNKWHDGIAN